MPTAVGTQFQTSPAQAQLRDQLLTVFRDSRQLKENSAQLRQRLVTAVFSTIQGQIDTARSERFAESEASKGRKGQRQAIALQAGIPAVGGAVTGGIAGGIAGGAEGATLGALAGASAGFGLPVARGAGSPASTLFDTRVGGPDVIKQALNVEKSVLSNVVPPTPASVSTQNLTTPTFPEDFVPAASPALTPAGRVEKATNAIAQIAGLDNERLISVGEQATEAGDFRVQELISAELVRRGLAQ